MHTLVDFLFGSTKLAIWLTRKNQIRGAGSVSNIRPATLPGCAFRVKMLSDLDGLANQWLHAPFTAASQKNSPTEPSQRTLRCSSVDRPRLSVPTDRRECLLPAIGSGGEPGEGFGLPEEWGRHQHLQSGKV